jgi:glycosyltransferase involved in cell wall biosynthesis
MPELSEQKFVSIAVVIPCFRVREQILDVLSSIRKEITNIYVIDDACPENSGQYVEKNCSDSRVTVVQHESNQGVGGATITGYQLALKNGASIIVKMDGDGQMDASSIPGLIEPLLSGEADYSKGNRFSRFEDLRGMPVLRLLGNSFLSFISKFSSGYWNVLDPTNGFTAIHANVVSALPIGKLSKRFFFESDMLFQLNLIRAVVVDVPMRSRYLGESSNLRIRKVGLEFLIKHMRNAVKRIICSYFLHNVNIASTQLLFGLPMLVGGASFGLWKWTEAFEKAEVASSGTVMLAALPIIIGIQLLIAFMAYDIQSVPKQPIHLTQLTNDSIKEM